MSIMSTMNTNTNTSTITKGEHTMPTNIMSTMSTNLHTIQGFPTPYAYQIIPKEIEEGVPHLSDWMDDLRSEVEEGIYGFIGGEALELFVKYQVEDLDRLHYTTLLDTSIHEYWNPELSVFEEGEGEDGRWTTKQYSMGYRGALEIVRDLRLGRIKLSDLLSGDNRDVWWFSNVYHLNDVGFSPATARNYLMKSPIVRSLYSLMKRATCDVYSIGYKDYFELRSEKLDEITFWDKIYLCFIAVAFMLDQLCAEEGTSEDEFLNALQEFGDPIVFIVAGMFNVDDKVEGEDGEVDVSLNELFKVVAPAYLERLEEREEEEE